MICDSAFKLATLLAKDISVMNKIPRKIDIKRIMKRRTTRKFKSISGLDRTALVFTTFVIKVQHVAEDGLDQCLKKEADHITKLRSCKEWLQHFPETHIVEVNGTAIQIQERVDMKLGKHLNALSDLEYDVEEFAEDILGIDDVHDNNFGWRMDADDQWYPVIVDVGCHNVRRIPKKRMTWNEWIGESICDNIVDPSSNSRGLGLLT